MRIAELEARTGLGRHTLRYYEQQGLLGKIARDSNNYRNYPETLVRDVHLLKQMQVLGFSLAEIRAKVEEQIANLKAASRLLGKEQKRLEARARQHGFTVATTH